MRHEPTSFCGIDCTKCLNYKKNLNCQGCRHEKELIADCPTRGCATESKCAHCGQCPIFPCQMMADFYHNGSESRLKAYETIKNVIAEAEGTDAGENL